MHKMKKPNVKKVKKPLLAIISIFCAAASLPIARIFADILAPKEDLLGYGALGIALIVLILSLFAGFVIGLIALFRGEHPRTLSILASLLNGAALVWVVASMPG